MLQQVQFGILLGYKSCCIDNYCNVLPPNDEEYWKKASKRTPMWKTPHGKWYLSVRLPFVFISDWVRHHFEKVGMTKVSLCSECREDVVKHVYEQRDDWVGAKRKVIDFERRVFEEEYDPTLKELQDETHSRWNTEKIAGLVKESPADIFDILFANMNQ